MRSDNNNKVEVYFNLHKKTFSVRSCKTGKVLRHTDSIYLVGAEFVVRPSGRSRVIREGKKNVHAFVRGYVSLLGHGPSGRPALRNVTYNPYKYTSFVDKLTEGAIHRANRAWLTVTNKIPTIQAEE